MAEHDDKKLYLAWLNDAHAMELGLASILEKQVSETKSMPELQAKLREHLEVTRHHAELVASCIERQGGTVSGMKDFIAKATAGLQGLGMSMMEDVLVKQMHSAYAAEHFEIATYTILQTAAEQFDDEDTAMICSDIVDDEIDMANWLLEHLPVIVEQKLEEKRATA